MKFESGFDTYSEQIPMPWALRAIFYFSALAMVIGIAWPAYYGDEEVTGWAVWVYYPGLSLGLVVMTAVALWFRRLSVAVDNQVLAFGYGRFRKRFKFDQIESVVATPYSYMKYGGAGIRYARHGHRAWSVPFVHTGVEVKLSEGGKDRTYYISSRNADELAEAIRRRLKRDRRGAAS